MKTEIRLDLPSTGEIIRGLTPAEVHPAFAEAERRLKDAEQRLVDTEARRRASEVTVDRLRRDVATGRAAVAELEAAIGTVRALALTIPALEREIEEAKAGRDAEWRKAQDKIQERVRHRAQHLKDVAARIAPVLEELRRLDVALGQMVDRDAVTVGVTWPVPMQTEIALAGASSIIGHIGLNGDERVIRR
ncbi:MAG TPA: hypothetical protein VNN19_10385 [bacterium]|nr:hypothetical protein [bacterium]